MQTLYTIYTLGDCMKTFGDVAINTNLYENSGKDDRDDAVDDVLLLKMLQCWSWWSWCSW